MLARWSTKHIVIALSPCYCLACRNNVYKCFLEGFPEPEASSRNGSWDCTIYIIMKKLYSHCFFLMNCHVKRYEDHSLYNSGRGYGALLHWKLCITVTQGPEILGLIREVTRINRPIQCTVGIGSNFRTSPSWSQCEGDLLIQVTVKAGSTVCIYVLHNRTVVIKIPIKLSMTAYM